MKPFADITLALGLVVSLAAQAAPAEQTMTVTRNGTQASAEGPAQYFTGAVRVDPLFPPRGPSQVAGAYVSFEPGARSAWHTHPLGQTLVVTAGTGWIQQEGGEKIAIKSSGRRRA